ncbi:MAG: DoxX family protein [Chloroflexaceae bacterium]|nr:DoxX family protein [Chloroflexaceae bacterium]
MFKIFERYQFLAPFILRLVIGLVFLLHGLAKFGVLGDGSIQQTTEMFSGMNMPLPGVTAPLVAAIEVIGGLALLIGLGTRFACIPLVVIMLVAIVAVKLPNELNPIGRGGYELDLLLLAGLVVLLLLGSGPLAVERKVLKPDLT